MAGEEQACCSFQSYVGGVCTSSRLGKLKVTETVTLLSCNKDISNHKTSRGFSDVVDEVDLILARASSSRSLKDVALLSWQSARLTGLNLVLGGTQKCRVPNQLSNHGPNPGKWPKAERGIGKSLSSFILKSTGVFVPVGSGSLAQYIIFYV